MKVRIGILLTWAILLSAFVLPTFAQETTNVTTTNTPPDDRISKVEQDVQSLRVDIANLRSSASKYAGEGLVAFLFGAFCALWAQNTGRNPWLWFFMGLIFSCVTVLVLLYKNSEEDAA